MFQVVRRTCRNAAALCGLKSPFSFRVVVLVAMFNLVLSAVMIVGTPILITQVLGMSDTLYGLTQGVSCPGRPVWRGAGSGLRG